MDYKIFALILFAFPVFSFQNGGEQPNIILIVADDLGEFITVKLT